DTKIRAGLPKGWRVGDKTGSGSHGSTNDVAVIWPDGRPPVIVAVYLTETAAPDDKRNAAHAAVGRAVAGVVGGQREAGHCAGSPELLNRGLVVAGAAQDLVGMLTDAGRLARLHLPGAVDEDRTVDGQHGVVLEGHQHLVLDHLLVVRDVVEDADHAEHQ